MTSKDRARLRQLHAMLGSSSAGERENAWKKVDAWLRKHSKTWNDLPELLHDETAQARIDPRDVEPSQPVGSNVTPLDLVRAFLQDYVAIDPHDYVAVALWAVHTHVFDKFMVTPRLVLTSPVRGCGKTTLVDVLSRLVARPEKSDNITAAAIYDTIDRERCTLLIDEADNLELSAKGALRAVLNSGHRKGGTIRRGTGKHRHKYSTYAPIALASIGILTLPLMSRSIVIHMRRHDGTGSLHRFESDNTQDLHLTYQHIRMWARDAALNLNPDMPVERRDRTADNWRPLISIADVCGEAWGRLAREAAVAFTQSYRDEDIVVILLRDIREIFDARGVDRLNSQTLIDALNAMDDAGWSEYRGPHGDQQPRKLTQGELARLLQPFGIRPRTIWPAQRRSDAKSRRGYLRSQFERAWASYCAAADTPTQASKVIALAAR
jgi:hypothetical protein